MLTDCGIKCCPFYFQTVSCVKRSIQIMKKIHDKRCQYDRIDYSFIRYYSELDYG